MTRGVARAERGFALTELLVAVVLMVAIMGTAFGALSQFEQTSNRNNRQNDAQDKARNAIDLIVRRLRNDASPTPGSPQGVDRAMSDDLVFQSVDPNAAPAGSDNSHNVMRVRYCLDNPGSANAKIWFQAQKWTGSIAPAAPSGTNCPATGWDSSRVLVDHVSNGSRPIWTTDCPSGYTTADCDAGTDPGMLARVKRIGMEIFVDEDPAKAPPETRLSTGVFFRNQNARPTAALGTPTVQAGHIYANASISSDPDADRMFFRWCYLGTASPGAVWCAGGTELPQQTVAIDYSPTPTPPSGTPVTIGVRVQDQGGLVSYAYKQVVFP